MLHIHFKCLCKFSKQLGGGGERQHWWEQRLKKQEQIHPGIQCGEGEARIVQNVTETLSLPLQRAGTPWLHGWQAIVSPSTELRADQGDENHQQASI